METIVALNSNLKPTKFASIEDASKSNPYLIYSLRSSTFKNAGYTNTQFDWNFYDSNGVILNDIIEGRWSIRDFKGTSDAYYQKILFGFSLVEPNGKITRYSKVSVEKGIAFLRIVSAFENLENYLLHTENEQLKEKNEILKLKNKELYDLLNNASK